MLVATYATGRALPAKYLVPGTLMLALFVVYPIVLTAQTSFTNYGDGTRNDKQTTVDRIVGSSVVRSDDSPQYNLTIATDGDPASGPFTYFLVPQDDPETVFEGTPDGLEEGPDGVTLDNGRVTAIDGFTILDIRQVSDAADALDEIAVPTDSGSFIVRDGTSEAFEGAPTLVYDEDETFYQELAIRLSSDVPTDAGEKQPGLVIVQIDGLAAPVLRNAIRVGLVPRMAAWVRSDAAVLTEWECPPPSQTSASQAGILHGPPPRGRSRSRRGPIG